MVSRFSTKHQNIFPKFNTTGRSLPIQLRLAPESSDPLSHLEDCIKSLSEYLFQDIPVKNVIGFTIRNTEKVMGIPEGCYVRVGYAVLCF
jgi:hypothetical protein